MSTERDSVVIGEVSPTEEVNRSEQQNPVTETREQIKARLAQVLDRGIVADRLKVDLPPGIYGEWVVNNPMEIFRMEAMGFKIDTEHAPKRALHSDGTGKSIVGDVVFMTCNSELKSVIDEIRREQYLKINRKGKDQREEKEVLKSVEAEGLPATSEGSVTDATKETISAALGYPIS